MLSSMAYTQADLDTIEAAIKSGEKELVLDGNSVTYTDVDDLLKIRNLIQRELNGGSIAKRTYPRFQVATFNDG